MSDTTHTVPEPITGRQDAEENGSIKVSLQFSPQVSCLLKDMCDSHEANDVIDALKQIIGTGFQVQDQLHKGYVEAIFQNPQKRHAVLFDLRNNLG